QIRIESHSRIDLQRFDEVVQAFVLVDLPADHNDAEVASQLRAKRRTALVRTAGGNGLLQLFLRFGELGGEVILFHRLLVQRLRGCLDFRVLRPRGRSLKQAGERNDQTKRKNDKGGARRKGRFPDLHSARDYTDFDRAWSRKRVSRIEPQLRVPVL